MQKRNITIRFAFLASVLLLIGTISACSSGGPELETAGHKGANVYSTQLTELNDSGAQGHATLVSKRGELRVNLDVSGLLSGAVHLQHIHGFDAGTVASCPTLDQDTDDDGLINLLEGAAVYGPIRITLGKDVGSAFEYSRVFDAKPAQPIAEKHIIVHGVDIDGDGKLETQRDINGDGMIGGTSNGVLNLTEAAFELTMPALCGELSRNN